MFLAGGGSSSSAGAASSKRCFSIESLVGKESPEGQSSLRSPPALACFPPGGPEAPFGAPPPAFPGAAAAASGAGRGPPLYGAAELLFPDGGPLPAPPPPGAHLQGPHHQHHPHPFFAAPHQPRADPLGFYPWVLRNRFFSHRFQ
ncbi:homeobox protein EMX1-like, partial [Sceloporus undulatus]|uniref:homeobox protein EMX1-like n=1 Tax=Sceloporus undulatus TaxID=8520 RepID=UPI001C4A8CE5